MWKFRKTDHRREAVVLDFFCVTFHHVILVTIRLNLCCICTSACWKKWKKDKGWASHFSHPTWLVPSLHLAAPLAFPASKTESGQRWQPAPISISECIGECKCKPQMNLYTDKAHDFLLPTNQHVSQDTGLSASLCFPSYFYVIQLFHNELNQRMNQHPTRGLLFLDTGTISKSQTFIQCKHILLHEHLFRHS